MTTVGLITGIFGDYDTLKELPVDHGFDDAVCVTDVERESDSWRIHRDLTPGRPRLIAKQPKMMPFRYLNTDVAVWVDGSFQVSEGFKDFCLSALGDKDIVVWEHPEDRDCLYQEAEYCQDWPKYSGSWIREQTAHYRSKGMPERFGLWACGAVVWRDSEAARKFGDAWFRENRDWSIQDQISFPYLVWKMEPSMNVFPAHEFDNPYLRWLPHKVDNR